MKKIYSIPQLQIVHINENDLIATSDPVLGNGSSDPSRPGLARSWNWDDDDWE